MTRLLRVFCLSCSRLSQQGRSDESKTSESRPPNENVGLVPVGVLRRLLDDDSNAMETEKRSVFIKLRKQNRQATPIGTPSAQLKPFLSAVTPLLCRDQKTCFEKFGVDCLVLVKHGASGAWERRPLALQNLTFPCATSNH